ncbi:L,D-peptidoglycan transpeptidase YkuD (ErfK/YbiS/YcfS/YnhG family) [Geodermatophilus normandii]|uniref:L,D-peptidoglycan transpeptidase YkuD (ErfK/YbiS/YcfS/YnhG family) n=1 Tax=Geodermatophilus normandii TaxID=1137989 RepID=A0A317QNS4_9ACTN|nr:L,D-peptidoglycan transpeptidase YkuD (ErfK/YbiS/YcfS/YnhG family) [Geodermatophilus normandii]
MARAGVALLLTAGVLGVLAPPTPGAAATVPAAVVAGVPAAEGDPVGRRPAVGQVPRATAAPTTAVPAPGPAADPVPSPASAPVPEPVVAAPEQPGPGPRAVALPLDVAAGGSTQVVTVVAASSGATTAELTGWELGPGGWTVVHGPWPARVGASGVGAAREGATRTPAGTFPLPEAFGRAPDPGSGLPYRQVDEQDWWVSDVASPLYDQHARCAPGTCPFDEGAGENLLAAGAVYDHAVVIGYNPAGIPGAGSAFFLHVSDGAPTAGCVALERGRLQTLLRWLDPAAGPLIAIGVG